MTPPQPADDDPDPRAWWPLADADDLRDELVAAWRRDGYHDLRHLTEVLRRLDELDSAGAAFERLPVLLAAWFHDAVYDGERDAEERSACWAERALDGLVDLATVDEVARLVRLTETHRPDPDDAEGCALSDADLAILASDPVRYAEYVAAVRREYAHLDDDTFAAGRAEVLHHLAAKPTLFHTAPARRRWEEPARANLRAELDRLMARVG
ncbi:HD domain-containing protein [Nocardioides acrostichi]|nr:hypothetical protein [Nocardioides acrostichi]